MKELHRRVRFSIITGLFYSFLFYFGTKILFSVTNKQAVSYSVLDFVFLIPIIIVVSFAFYFIFGIKSKIKENKGFSLKRRHIFIPLFITTIITFLAVFPGHYPFDAWSMDTMFRSGEYSTHYAPLVSFIIGTFMSIGRLIGSEAIGHTLLIAVQSLFLNFVITEIIYYCSKKLKQKSFSIIFVLFFILHPLVQTLLVRSGQDTIFGGFFALLTLEFLNISEDEKNFTNYFKPKLIYLSAIIFLVCATRNNGIYALLPALISVFFIVKNKEVRKNLLIVFLIPIVIFFGYKNLFINNVVVDRDSFFRETLNIPVLQIARSMYYHPDLNMKEELKEYFEEDCMAWIHEKWSWEKYDESAGISDPYKDCLKTAEIEKDPIKFFKLWAKIGTNNTLNYIEAPIALNLSLFHPYAPYNEHKYPYRWHTYIDCYYDSYDRYGIKNTSLVPPLNKLLFHLISDEGWSEIPILHIVWGAPFTLHLCLITILFTFYRRKYQYLLPLILIFGLILTVVLSPVILFRYLFPAVICTPIMVYILKTVLK